MKHSKIGLALMLGSLFFSCKKNETRENTKPANNLNVLENKLVGNWLFVQSTDSNINSTGVVKVTNAMDDCENDDIYTFGSDKKYTINDGAKICSINYTGQEFTWSITADSNFEFLHIENLGDAKCKIIQLDDEILVIRSYFYGGPFAGGNYVINTYKKR